MADFDSGAISSSRKSDARWRSFDAAFIGGSLAVGAMLFVILMTVKDLFPPMN